MSRWCVSAALVMLCSVQVDSQPYTVAFDTYNATFYSSSVVAATANINLTIEIDQIYMGVDSDSGFIGIGDGDELMLKLSSPVLSVGLDPLYGVTSRSGSVPLTVPSVCSYSEWSSKVKGTLSRPIKLLDRRIIPLDSSLSFLDRIGFVFFDRPNITFSIVGFEDDSGYLDCVYRSSDDDNYASQTFSDLQLCYTENSVCNIYIGTSLEQGWLYFGGSSSSPYYGIHVNPTWSLSGTRRSLDLAAGKFFDVVAVPSNSDIYSSQVINATSSPAFEMDEITLRNGSMILFHLNSRGEAMRHLAAYSLKFNGSIGIVLDFAEPLAVSNASSFSLVLPKLIDANFGGPTSAFVLALNRAPAKWTVLSQSFVYTGFSDVLALNATIGLASAAVTTTTAPPTTPAPTAVVYRCERNCAGHGLCVAESMCRCDSGWVNDPNKGCIDENELRTAATDATNVVISNVVNPSMVVNATAETNNDGTGASATGTTPGDGTPPAQRTAPAERGGDNTVAIAAGAGAGALVCLLLICGVLICLTKRRRDKQLSKRDDAMSAIALTEKEPARADGVYVSSAGAMQNYVGASNIANGSANDSVYKSPSTVEPSGSADYAFMPTTELPTTLESSAETYTVPDLESAGGDLYTVPALPDQATTTTNSAAAEYDKIEIRASKKKSNFKPEGVDVEYGEFDPNSARFEKYRD